MYCIPSSYLSYLVTQNQNLQTAYVSQSLFGVFLKLPKKWFTSELYDCG